MPWANGGGLTHEVIRVDESGDPGAFAWRVSVATIETDADFSALPGVDRIIMPLSGGGLTLDLNGERVTIARHRSRRFRGEDRARARDVAAPAIDLNLMWRRRPGRSGRLETQTIPARPTIFPHSSAHRLVVLLEGTADLAGVALAVLDAVHLEPGETASIRGPGTIAVASVRGRQQA
ncbi:MAG: HutD family protein [Herbiconiux sp.]|nr:HutD family protein [Herbiconiux sp.]